MEPAAQPPSADPSAITSDRRNRWLPWTVLLAAVVVVAELLDGVREHSDLSRLDPVVTSDAIARRDPVLTFIASTFTFLGSELVIGGLTLITLGWLAWRRRWADAGLVAFGMSVSVGLTVILKQLVGRPRPPAADMLGPIDTAFSFPSGHTLNSTVFVGLITILALDRVCAPSRRALLILGWAAFSLAVGLSRIYLGYHWMTDVLAGWALGIGVLALSLLARAPIARLAGAPPTSDAAARSLTGT